MTSTFLELVLPTLPSSVRDGRVAAGEAVAELGGDERLADDVRLCVSEAVTNAVRHAYGSTPGSVEVVLGREGDELVVVVRDEGVGPGRPSSRGSSGGFGLKIIAKVASRHTIESARGGGTAVRMVFALGGR